MTGVPEVAPRRIASLLSAATELVCALGVGERLVARSHECDTPEWVKALPAASRPTFDITGSSREIDARVRALIAAGEPLYEVDQDLLDRLAPDLLITQTHCEVCAVAPGDIQRGAPTEAARPVVSLQAGTLEGVLDSFQQVADLLGLSERGRRLVAGLRERVDRVADRTRGLERPTVVCVEWLDPVYVAANWTPELVSLAGGVDALGRPGEHSSATPWNAVRRADPDVLVVAACGFGLERTLAEMDVLAANPGWSDLRAVRHGRVFVADGNLYFNRSGPSLFETVEILAEMLHPSEFAPTHHGRTWQPYPEANILSSKR
jgi:iron complex transport system substrate-binding protein